jgi:hypothetical protein
MMKKSAQTRIQWALHVESGRLRCGQEDLPWLRAAQKRRRSEVSASSSWQPYAVGGQSILKIDPNLHPCWRIRAGRKIMNRRTSTTMVLLGLAVATALPQIAFAQTDPFLGTWQLNLAKSKYSPGPPPKSQSTNVQADGQIHRLTITGIDAAGNPISVVFTRTFDGTPHPSKAADFDAVTITRADDYTIIISRTRAGKLVQTATDVVSQDGKTLTTTTIGSNANGQPINIVGIHDKQ